MFGVFIMAAGWLSPWWDEAVTASIERAPARQAAWEAALLSAPSELRAHLTYLVTYLPERDLEEVPPSVLVENVRLAHTARRTVPWGANLPEDIFREAVLPHRSVTEPIDWMRDEFYARYLPLVQDARTPGEAALRLNAALFRDYGVTYNTRRLRTDQGPRETIAQGMATCTGLSIMLIEACRALAIPARFVGIASWPGRGGNHSWVEIWDQGWHFVGAAEPDDKGLNHAWFVGDAATAQRDVPESAIWAAAYRPTGEFFPLAWNRRAQVPGVNVTDHYARPREDARPRLMVEVRRGGTRVEVPTLAFHRETGARVLDGTSLGPQADINLHLQASVEPGEYLVVAHDEGRVTSTKVRVEADTVVRLSLDTLDVPPVRELLAERFGPDPTLRQAAAAVLDALPYDAHSARLAWEAFLTAPADEQVRAEMEAQIVRTVDRESPYRWRHVGERPTTGWGLVIAMHGGGATSPEFNDRAWMNMFERYYRDHPDAGGYIYLALRAPNDEWNGFYDDAISPLIEELIFRFVRFEGVDPNAVYILGASHGGYGAFVIGPKIPFRFAAVHASAAAPTDGVTRGENLRNTVFTWMIGENDTAYGRDWRCRVFEERFFAWRREFGGFPGGMEWLPGVGHSVPDRDKVADMLRSGRRDPLPRRVLWSQSDDRLRHFFWLEAPQAVDGGWIDAKIDDNRITLVMRTQTEVALWLRPELVDFSRPVTVIVGGREETHVVRPSLETYCRGLEARRDPYLAAPVRLAVRV